MLNKGERNMVAGLEEELAKTKEELRELRAFLLTTHRDVLKEYEAKKLADLIFGKIDEWGYKY